MTDPDAAISRWRAALGAFVLETQDVTRRLAVALVEQELPPRSRARLTRVAEAMPKHRDAVVGVLRDAGLELPAEGETGTVSSPDALMSYYTLIHRDWGWAPEVDEVTPALDAIEAVLPSDFRLGTTLVLGAGTGRLAWELGLRRGDEAPIVALDVNPLPLLVTRRLMQGKPTALYELPGHPRRSSVAAIERSLDASTEPPPGLSLVLGDGLSPPVARGRFDTVITPWFVDQVPHDVATLPPVIRQVLREGGSWINQGPLVYDPARTAPEHRYCADELLEIVAAAGFQVRAATYEKMAYLASPVSTQGRTETVLTMHAVMREPGSQPAREEPRWLRADQGVGLPVPRLSGLESYAAPHPTVAAVASRIDGKRSVADIARNLVRAGELADDGAAEVAVRGCLKIIWKALGSG